MTSLYFVRGPSGVGKTTLAKEMAQKYDLIHVEADQFFERGGKYAFNASLLGVAHRIAKEKMKDALESGKGVVVSNTSTRLSEVDRYLDAVPDGIEVHVVDLKRDGQRAEYKNTHNVPASKVAEHAARFQSFPPERRLGAAKNPDGSNLSVPDSESYQISVVSDG